MFRFIDDLVGSISDLIKFLITSLGYLIAGMLLVGVPLYLLVQLIGFLTN